MAQQGYDYIAYIEREEFRVVSVNGEIQHTEQSYLSPPLRGMISMRLQKLCEQQLNAYINRIVELLKNKYPNTRLEGELAEVVAERLQ